MDRYKKEFMSGVDVSKRELIDLKEAFKKDEFRELFKEYVEDVTSPESQALYEKELLQLERERGVDSTLLRPSPGYVLKTSVEGDCQAYVNVAYNDKIAPPTSERIVRNGEVGTNWSLPHVFSKGRMEMNKEGVEILAYDVLFHPMALDLAHRHPELKELLNQTAMQAVEDNDRVKLDRRNARVVKSNFVGGKHPCILRKKAASSKREDAFEMPNYPYPNLDSDPEPVVKEVGLDVPKEEENYTTPVFKLKEKKRVDLSEFRLSKYAKMMSTIPEELVLDIRLPMLRSSREIKLDVTEKTLSLISEEPAKYKLEVKLPYSIDEDSNFAQFDKDKKVLTVTLPVLRSKYEIDVTREDSGIDSDAAHNRSSSEEELSMSTAEPDNERMSEEVTDDFLQPSKAYTLPPFTVTLRSDKCFIVLYVKNVDPSTVNHQFWASEGVWLKFGSVAGDGKFPSYHAVCFQAPQGLVVDRRTLRVEVWDNNLICSMKVQTLLGSVDKTLDRCRVGLDPTSLTEAKVAREPEEISRSEGADSDDDFAELTKPDDAPEDLVEKLNKLQTCSQSDQIVEDEVFVDNSVPEKDETLGGSGVSPENLETPTNDKPGAAPAISSAGRPQKRKDERTNKNLKVRTLSESSVPVPAKSKRSILKISRSLSECHGDELVSGDWSSLDSNESPEEHCNAKKTVRFSDVVSKKIFRANSSILGQRKKNEKKSRNRKKAAERRASESEQDTEVDDVSASEVSEVSDATDVSAESSDDNSTPMTPVIEPAKHHRRRGSKNRRKNASTAKQNYLLNRDL